ncbi:RRXRR domain-containing protein [Streptosporangium sp. G12]
MFILDRHGHPLDPCHPARARRLLAAGRGTYARTTPDRYGFPRLVRPRIKLHHGFQTGDLVRANVPAGKKAGLHAGRVLVRSSGSFDITTRHGRVTGINHRHVRHLQRADGYGYATQKEADRND